MSTTLQGSGSVPRHADRRHPRQRVSSLQYIELGQENGGIVLNIGEGGLAITSAVPLTTLELPAIRFRLPGSPHWIEAAAEVAWTGASRKEAGIRFVQLKPDDQDLIKSWVASRIEPQAPVAPPAPERPALETVPEPAKPIQASPLRPPEPQIVPQASVAPAPPILETVTEPAKATQASPLSASEPPIAAVPSVTPVAAIPPPPVSPTSAPNIPATPVAGNAGPVPPAQIPTDNSPRGWAVLEYHGDAPQETFEEPGHRSSIWLKTIVLIAAVAIISFALGSAAGRNMWSNLAGLFSGQSSSGPANGDLAARTDPSANPVESAPPPPRGAYNTTPHSSIQTRPSATPSIPTPAETNMQPPQQANQNGGNENAATEYGPSDNQSVFNSSPPHRSSRSSSRPNEKSYGSERLPSPAAAVPHSPVMEPSADTALSRNAPSAPVEQPRAVSPEPATPATDAGEASAPVSSLHEFPGTAGTVEVISNPYPSPRVSMAVLSQSRSKTNLQIGPVLSRVEPLYPLEAVHQRLEGTVKLHVVVGLTGAVDRVELKNGPILLANAARIAVQQWRYKPTLLRNVPVESEEDVTVVFRLSRPANSGR